MLISNVFVLSQLQDVVIISKPEVKNKNSGKRLTKKAVFTAVLTWESAHSGVLVLGERVVRRG